MIWFVCFCAGFGLWAFGLLYEAIADYHKFYFRLVNQDKKVFVRTGVWRFSRHPNYFGEILLWWGVFIVAASGLEGLQYLTVLSPIFVSFLLTRVSGVRPPLPLSPRLFPRLPHFFKFNYILDLKKQVPLLEKQYNVKYAGDAKYEEYKAKTPVLIPNFAL